MDPNVSPVVPPVAAPVVDPSKPAVTTPASSAVTPAAPATPPTAADLVKRSAGTPAKPEPAKTEITPDDFKLDSTKILEGITDPTQKQFFEQKLKDAERGITAKFMTLAERTRALESEKAEIARQASQPWTPDRVMELIKKPEFVQSVQSAFQQQRAANPPSGWEGTEEEWSALSDKERQAFGALEQKVNHLLANQQTLVAQQEHEQVKLKYPDYDANKVETFQRQVIDNTISNLQLKEMIWKAINFDRHVEQAYQFGLQDRDGTLKEKMNGASVITAGNGSVVTVSEDKPKQEPGERVSEYFRRIARWNLQRAKAGSAK